MVFIVDQELRLRRINRAAETAAGRAPAEIIGRPCYELFCGGTPPASCPPQEALRAGRPAVHEFYEPGLKLYIEESSYPVLAQSGQTVAVIRIAKHVHRPPGVPEQLLHTGKLAAIGELAAGVAHELNNPLTSVIGFSQLVLRKEASPAVRGDLAIIQHEAQRAGAIVRNLLTFARQHAPARQPTQVNSALGEVCQLRAYEQRVNNITVMRELDPALPEVTADCFQLQQAFLNIIVNAEQAMLEAHGRGTLRIRTERAGEGVRISFSDDGPGISAENLPRVFHPFFTTKEVGRGTGLGLSICQSIVTQHGGRIRAESRPGEGARFVIELPRQGAPAAPDNRSLEPALLP